jgi:hypothetical protein
VESNVGEVLLHTLYKIFEAAATFAFLAIAKELKGIAVPEFPEMVIAI